MSSVVNAGVSVVSVEWEGDDGDEGEVHIAIFPSDGKVDVSQLNSANFVLMEPDDARRIAAALIFTADHIEKAV